MKKQLILLASVILFLTNITFAAPQKNLWPKWQQFNPFSTLKVNNKPWNQFLKKYVHSTKTGLNLVAYQKVSKQDKVKLQHYIHYLSNLKISQYSRKQQLAFWINLYNAETVNVVLQHYPVNSILKISSGWFSHGPWDKKRLTIDGTKVSLNDIEHRILRPIWNDPRLHYALNCASIGCPNLRRHAYNAKTIYQQLDSAAEQYINSPRAVKVVNGKLSTSKIYKWYEQDFGGTDQDVINHLKEFARPKLKRALNNIHTISSSHYDWKLNQYKTH